jgi:curved DNA-binding protein CbpA
MSFQIERGLFRFDFTDHHAVLGIPVNADVKEVRKRYLNIARKLHPDSNKAESESEKKLASQLLSKLVNPAYEQLSQNNRDFVISLGHMGRRLAAEAGKVPVDSAAAKQLSQAGANLDITYKSLVQKLASGQYESLNQVLEKIAEISELNMVYLMVKAGRNEGINNGAPKTPVGTGAPRTPTATGTGAPRTPTGTGVGTSGGLGSNLADSQGASRVDAYIRRGEGYLAKNNFAAAVLELREALKLDQNNSRAHALLGAAYLKQNQATMAKVHINKALQLNPKEELALKGKRHLEGLSGGKPSAPPKLDQAKQPDKSGERKFWPFGGKKN